MANIIHTIENTIYGYNPQEFMPIYYDGEVANRGAFVAYKLRRAVQHLGHAAGKTVEVTANAIDQMVEAAQ